MSEQARRLSIWMGQQTKRAAKEVLAERMIGARVMAITSGKGGVGKSTVTLNLGLALAMRGQRVLVLDADLGLANINIMLGYEPTNSLWDVVEHRASLRQIIQEAPGGIRLIPGASGIAALAELSAPAIERLVEGFSELESECDWLLIDTGAGIAPNVLAFVLAADEALVVTNPEPTAMADAYGLIKSVAEMEHQPSLKLLVNRVSQRDVGEKMGQRLTQLAERALDCPVEMVGTICDDPHAGRAIVRQTPLLLAYPKASASQDFLGFADRLLNRVPPPRRGGWGHFLRRMVKVWPGLHESEATVTPNG